jgi:circadian clock protein KaiC
VVEVQAHGPGLVFIDSFRSVVLASRGSDNAFITLQHFIQQLGILMASWQATTFLIGEYFSENDPNPVFTVADGLIWLRQSVQRNSMVRKMEIIKMRGQATLPGLHTFRIGSAGISVFSPPPVVAGGRCGSPRGHACRWACRCLDEMLGGGMPRGYSLLVAGPSGSGKSLMAEAFLIEGAASGRPASSRRSSSVPGRSRGRNLDRLIESGRVAVVDTRAFGLSVDELAMSLIAEINRLGASRVVIDSLSGFELALAPTFRDDFRESLSRMVSALAGTGVTVLMISELETASTTCASALTGPPS